MSLRTAAGTVLCGFALSAADPAALYRQHCAKCHDAAEGRIPRREALRQMQTDAVLRSLESGSMQVHAKAMSAEERRALASHLTAKPVVNPDVDNVTCASNTAFDPAKTVWNGWGNGPTNHRYQPSPGFTADDVPKLQLKWAFSLPSGSRAGGQPAIVSGRVFFGTTGRVYSLDARSGCVHWTYNVPAMVRTGIAVSGTSAVFGDFKANVYAVDAASGALLWAHKADTHPSAMITGTPVIHDGRVYVPVSSLEEVSGASAKYECCKFRGSVVALDLQTGKVAWTAYTIAEPARPLRKNKAGTQLWGPSGAAVWSAPTVDVKRNALYIATGDSYSDPVAATADAVMALDLTTGRVLWSQQMTPNDAWNMSCVGPDKDNCPESNGPDFDFGASPVLVDLGAGRRALIAGQKSSVVHALDPDRGGAMLWRSTLGKGGYLGGIQWGLSAGDKLIYAPLSDVAYLAPGKFNPSAGGGLFAINPVDGEKVWIAKPSACGDRPNCSPAQSAAASSMPGVVFSGSIDGHLRAYSTRDGSVIWSFDTAREFPAVNGTARGGSLDGPGPAIGEGMVFTMSGYAAFGGRAGNALLAFGR